MGGTTLPVITIGMVIVIGERSPVSLAQTCGGAYDNTTHSLPFRSPWSNEYDPPLADGTVPSAKLRKLEIQANDAFDTYREMLVYERVIAATTMVLIAAS